MLYEIGPIQSQSVFHPYNGLNRYRTRGRSARDFTHLFEAFLYSEVDCWSNLKMTPSISLMTLIPVPSHI